MDKYGAAAVRADLGMIKAHVSKVVLAVLDRTIQVCGALGYSSDLPVESWYRSTRFGPIGDGPDELHKSVLARTLLKSYSPVEGGRPSTSRAAGRRPRRSGPSCRAARRVPSVDATRRRAPGALPRRRARRRRPASRHAHGRRRLVRGVRTRPRAERGVLRARAAPRQLGHRPRRAARVPHPRRHQGRARARSRGRSSPAPTRRSSARRSTSWSASTGAPSCSRCPPPGPQHRRPHGRALEELDRRPGRDPCRRLAGLRARRPGPRRRLPVAPAHTWLAQLDSYGGRELPAAAPDRRLARRAPPADQPSALCHGDYKLDNVLFAPTRHPRCWRSSTGRWRHRRSARRPGLGAHLPSRARRDHAPRHGQGADVRGRPPPRPPRARRALRGQRRAATRPRSAGTTCSPAGSWPSCSKAVTPSSCAACPTSRSTSSSAARSICCWPAPPTIIDRGDRHDPTRCRRGR